MRMRASEAARKIDALGHALNNFRDDILRYADFFEPQSEYHAEYSAQLKAQYLSDIDYIRSRMVDLRNNVTFISDSPAAETAKAKANNPDSEGEAA